MPLNWRGPQVLDEIAAKACRAVDEFNLRVEAAGKAELYPGHGKKTGRLQRSIQFKPARREGNRVIGSVGTTKLIYALPMHKKFEYLTKAFQKIKPQFKGILARHMKG